MAQERTEKPRKKTDSVGRGLYWLYVLFLLCSLALIARLVHIQLFYQPDPKVVQALTPTSVRKTIDPARGAILSDDGRLLAMSLPIYDIYMDCTVMKEAYAKIRAGSKAKGDSLENAWMQKASELSKGLARILKEKSADEYYNLIKKGREQNRRYVRIASDVERREFNRILELPLFNEDRFHGGLIVEEESIRKYPYGKLARRTIGFVRNNKSDVSNTHVGIEGKFDYVLHGKDGVEYLREIDNKGRVQDSDSSYFKAEDGMDVRTTLNIDFQDIADKALREQLEGQEDIEGGCLVLMEVSTGAIKAMVNLTRDSVTTALEEVQNFAIGRRCEPGSVFKRQSRPTTDVSPAPRSRTSTSSTTRSGTRPMRFPSSKASRCRPTMSSPPWPWTTTASGPVTSSTISTSTSWANRSISTSTAFGAPSSLRRRVRTGAGAPWPRWVTATRRWRPRSTS